MLFACNFAEVSVLFTHAVFQLILLQMRSQSASFREPKRWKSEGLRGGRWGVDLSSSLAETFKFVVWMYLSACTALNGLWHFC